MSIKKKPVISNISDKNKLDADKFIAGGEGDLSTNRQIDKSISRQVDKSTKETQKVSYYISKENAKKIKMLAVENEKTLSEVVDGIFGEYFGGK